MYWITMLLDKLHTDIGYYQIVHVIMLKDSADVTINVL